MTGVESLSPNTQPVIDYCQPSFSKGIAGLSEITTATKDPGLTGKDLAGEQQQAAPRGFRSFTERRNW